MLIYKVFGFEYKNYAKIQSFCIRMQKLLIFDEFLDTILIGERYDHRKKRLFE